MSSRAALSRARLGRVVSRVLGRGPRRRGAPLERVRRGRAPGDRAAAALALAERDGPDATAALTDALRDPAAEVRIGAALALASLRDPASIPALAGLAAGWTERPLLRCRRAALRTLRAFRSERAAVELARALATREGGGPLQPADGSALLAIVHAEPSGRAPGVVRTLVDLLAHENAAAADRAAALLQLLPAESAEPLTEALRTARDPGARRRAAVALRACRRQRTASALVAALRDPDPGVRAAAARTLGEMRDPAAAQALHAAADDSDQAVREAARSALSALGMGAAPGIAAGLASLARK